jgi:hypothetical protein
MDDHEILLLSWTQLTAMEMLDPDERHKQDKIQIEETLLADFDITNPQLVSRSFGTYKVLYNRKGETEEISFDTEDVESIYDI